MVQYRAARGKRRLGDLGMNNARLGDWLPIRHVGNARYPWILRDVLGVIFHLE